MRYLISIAAMIAVATVLLAPGHTIAQEMMAMQPEAAAGPTLEQALGNVAWKGNLPNPEMVEGKSSIVLLYATWCPKCNNWSGELFRQLVEAASKQPVVVFAINCGKSFDANYIAQRNFMGPNVFHGLAPGLHKPLGFQSDLFQYVIFSPDGKLARRGTAGSFFPGGPTGKEFVLARLLNSEGDKMGEFKVLNSDMPEQMRQIFWPVELGAPFTEKTLLTARRRLPEEMHDTFNGVISSYLQRQLQRCKDLYAGDMGEKIEAYELAKEIMAGFSGTPQGRQCRTFVTTMDGDKDFKVEIAASKAYAYAVRKVKVSPASLKREMTKVASRFEETHFGRLAAQAAENDQLPEG